MRTTKWIKWAAVGLLAALLAGCSSTPDSVEDPLSFDVDAQLPFVTAAPEAAAETPTPQPTAPWCPARAPSRCAGARRGR